MGMLDKSYTQTQISKVALGLLRELAWKRHKPMYEALGELLEEATAREADGVTQAPPRRRQAAAPVAD